MVLQELLEQLHSLLPGDVGPEVAVAAQQLMQPVHSSRGGEAGRVDPEALAVFADGHARPEQTGDLIPLEKTWRGGEKNILTFIVQTF